MKRTAILLTALVVLGPLVGCGSDQKTEIVNKIVGQLEQAVRDTNGIRTELESAILKAEEKKDKAAKEKKEDPNKVYLTKEDLNATIKAMGGLRKVGSELVRLRAQAESVKSKLNEDEKKELSRSFANRFAPQWAELKKAEEKLNVAVARATTLSDAPTERELRTELRNAKQEFVSLTRRH
jgi:hypothetical protein